jgi:hypothetical protein
MGHDVDHNTISLSGELVRMPDYQQPWSFCELRVRQPGGGVLFIALHVPTDQYLRLLEDLSPGDRLYAAGELAFSRSQRLEGRGRKSNFAD